MRILLDLRCLETASARRGIGRYTRELVAALRAAAPTAWSFAGLSWSAQGAALGLEDVAYRGPRRGISVLDRFILPNLLRRHRIDLYHATATALPSSGVRDAALVLTIYDLVADLFPRALSLRQRLAFRRTFRSARAADRVIAISETTRRELLARYALDPRRVVAIPIGVSTRFGLQGQVPASGSGWARPFLLYVGGLDPLKNVPFLLRVLERVRREAPEVRLVVAGEEGPRLRALQELARTAGVADHLRTVGYIEDGVLAAAYREATAFLFPSRYEGFGLPPLEAMAAGCPVVSTRCGALEEVLNGAGLFADPDDAQGWAGAVLELLRNPRTRERQVATGRERASALTWERTARRTVEVYREALREKGRS